MAAPGEWVEARVAGQARGAGAEDFLEHAVLRIAEGEGGTVRGGGLGQRRGYLELVDFVLAGVGAAGANEVGHVRRVKRLVKGELVVVLVVLEVRLASLVS